MSPDIIVFARELGMEMHIALGSREKVGEVLELLEIIEKTRFDDLPSTWCDQTLR